MTTNILQGLLYNNGKDWNCGTKWVRYVMLCTIWYHLYHLKNVKSTHGGVLILVKLQAKACNFIKINNPPLVFFTLFTLYKWYQIAQRITYWLTKSYETWLAYEVTRNLAGWSSFYGAFNNWIYVHKTFEDKLKLNLKDHLQVSQLILSKVKRIYQFLFSRKQSTSGGRENNYFA